MCGAAAAENTGYVEVPLIQNLESPCKAAGKPAPTLQLYDNNADCIQAILAGRADTYVNDVNTVDQAVKAYPDKLEKAVAVTLPYSVGIARAEGQDRASATRSWPRWWKSRRRASRLTCSRSGHSARATLEAAAAGRPN